MNDSSLIFGQGLGRADFLKLFVVFTICLRSCVCPPPVEVLLYLEVEPELEVVGLCLLGLFLVAV